MTSYVCLFLYQLRIGYATANIVRNCISGMRSDWLSKMLRCYVVGLSLPVVNVMDQARKHDSELRQWVRINAVRRVNIGSDNSRHELAS